MGKFKNIAIDLEEAVNLLIENGYTVIKDSDLKEVESCGMAHEIKFLDLDKENDYEREMRAIIFDIKERKSLSNEKIEETKSYYLNEENYDENDIHYLYSTIKELDPNSLSSADVHRNFFEYEDFMNENNS